MTRKFLLLYLPVFVGLNIWAAASIWMRWQETSALASPKDWPYVYPGETHERQSDGTYEVRNCSHHEIIYINGRRLPIDGWKTLHIPDTQMYLSQGFDKYYMPTSFPVIVFCNAGGLDVSGKPCVIRSVHDGQCLWGTPRHPLIVKFQPGLPDGMVHLWYEDGTDKVITQEEWLKFATGQD